MWKAWIKLAVMGILLGSALVSAWGQSSDIRPKLNSPYSRLGLGDPVAPYYTAQAGMAGLSAAIRTPAYLNLVNPASLAYQRVTSFELGIFAQFSSLESNRDRNNFWSGNLNYMALGFPLKNPINKAMEPIPSPFQWGMALALQPYTNVGYNVISEEEVGDLGLTTTNFKGSGGTYRLMWSNGWSYKNFAVGLNLGYLFGKLTNSRRIVFDSLAFSYNTEFSDDISVSGFVWNAGIMYTHDFKQPDENGIPVPSGKRLIFGAYGNTATGFSTNSSRFFWRDNLNLLQLDTIVFEEDIRERGRLPLEFSAGVTYEQIDKLRVGVEYQFGQWSQYFNEAKNEGPDDSDEGGTSIAFDNSWRIALGGEYIPDIKSYNNYLKRMAYRIGFFYGTDPRLVNGSTLTSYGASFGLGFPVVMPRGTTSFIQFAVEAGRFGTIEALRETYVRMTVGFTLNDNSWFFKRKFN